MNAHPASHRHGAFFRDQGKSKLKRRLFALGVISFHIAGFQPLDRLCSQQSVSFCNIRVHKISFPRICHTGRNKTKVHYVIIPYLEEERNSFVSSRCRFDAAIDAIRSPVRMWRQPQLFVRGYRLTILIYILCKLISLNFRPVCDNIL